ncbi:MAG: hypothetical protein K0R38_2402 [Polyangiaceae bacterium]|nr:hypothetical protein [Polyangiaceae bacterium]
MSELSKVAKRGARPPANAHAHTVEVLAQWRSLRAAVERLKVRLSSSATSVGGLTQFSNKEPC